MHPLLLQGTRCRLVRCRQSKPTGAACASPAAQVINQHKQWMEGKDVRGRIYISEQVGQSAVVVLVAKLGRVRLLAWPLTWTMTILLDGCSLLPTR